MDKLNLLAISGSLRKASYNTALIQSLQLLSPDTIEINHFDRLIDIPPFNPDDDIVEVPIVCRLENELTASDGLIIASPEYAHGISGVLKNTLDWLVGGEAFVNKPVVILNASPRASHAINQLKEVVSTMSGQIIEEACIDIPLLGSGLDAKGICSDPTIAKCLKQMLDCLKLKIQ